MRKTRASDLGALTFISRGTAGWQTDRRAVMDALFVYEAPVCSAVGQEESTGMKTDSSLVYFCSCCLEFIFVIL